ncbi:MAG: FecR domain-containing protein [Cyclobacteriaceae bacterium]|nr:FecR domain-containing protein [Cyclobacteriaceae bacterium]
MDSMQENIDGLISKYFEGSISGNELQLLLSLLSDSDENGIKAELLACLLEKDVDLNVGDIDMDFETAYDQIQHRMTQKEGKHLSLISLSVNSWYKLAAVIAMVLIGLSLTFFLINNADIVQHTTYGEIRTLVLPDGSSVILNGNSSIQYAKNWSNKQDRKVKLNGEALFDIQKTDMRSKFIVETSGGPTIEVTGTKFNVKDRGSKTKVVLSEGSVMVSDVKGGITVLKPGELLDYDKRTNTTQTSIVLTEKYTSWTFGKIILDNTSVSELIDILNVTYGVKIETYDNELLAYKLTGSVPTKNIENILMALTTTFGLEIINQNQKLILKMQD